MLILGERRPRILGPDGDVAKFARGLLGGGADVADVLIDETTGTAAFGERFWSLRGHGATLLRPALGFSTDADQVAPLFSRLEVTSHGGNNEGKGA